MKKIHASGLWFDQGAADSFAGIDERPTVRDTFTYDYWLDSTEVTQSAYNTYMHRNPVPDSSPYGKGDLFPVYNVSWFDAALFCNEKSKGSNLDTVYTYFDSKRSINGTTYDLSGLHIHFERNGFRLPTEAEWEFAAREGSSIFPFPHLKDSIESISYGWFDANAMGKTHPVAQLQANRFGLYDMAGNVYEWTQDWKGPYGIRHITNALGAPWPDDSYEKVIKGGAYNYPFLCLRPSRRSTTYPTSASSAAEYVGFRCARGVISNGSYITANNVNFTSNPVDLIITDLRHIVKAARAKLTFVNVTGNARTLCVVDFSNAHPHVFEFLDSQNVYVPTVSPDGKFVVYSTGGEGLGGNAKGYIRSLDRPDQPPAPIGSGSVYVPRFWIDRTTNDTFCIYTNSAIVNSDPSWSNTGTFMQKIANGIPTGAPLILTSNGSFHDGRSRDGRYLVTGYSQLIMRDMVAQQDRHLFVPPFNGKDALGSSQVCNVSISPDSASSDRCMFLDFGSPSVSSLTGNTYGIHQYLFVAQFSGPTTAWYAHPPQEQAWDFPEWTNIPRFAIACGSNNLGESHSIYVVDLEMKTQNKIAEGSLLEYPYLWIQNEQASATQLDIDSVGQYNDPPLTDIQNLIAVQLHWFWTKHDNIEIAIVGDSRGNDGIDPSRFPGFNAQNMAVGGGDFGTALALIHGYLLNHCPRLKMVILSVVLGSLNSPKIDGNFQSGTAQSKGYTYDRNHFFWRDSLPPLFAQIAAAVPIQQTNIDSLGFRHFACQGWGPATDVSGEALAWDTSDVNYIGNMGLLRSLIDTLSAYNTHLLMVELPMNPHYADGASYSLFGPSRETALHIISQLKAMEKAYPYFHFYDANIMGRHNYSDGEAVDELHLCVAGAKRVSDSIGAVINAILKH